MFWLEGDTEDESLPSAECEGRLRWLTARPVPLFSQILALLCFILEMRKLISGAYPRSESTPYFSFNLKDFQNVFLSDLVKFPSMPLK